MTEKVRSIYSQYVNQNNVSKCERGCVSPNMQPYQDLFYLSRLQPHSTGLLSVISKCRGRQQAAFSVNSSKNGTFSTCSAPKSRQCLACRGEESDISPQELVETKNRVNFTVYISGAEVEQVNRFRFLGIDITENLSWSSHTFTLVKKRHKKGSTS